MFLLLVCGLLILRGPIYNHYGLNSDDKVESFGIPLQQVGYILSSDGNISEEDKAFLNNIIPLEKWKQVYCPLIVDRVKWDPEFNVSYLNEHSGEFLKLYLRVAIQNPIRAVKGYGLETVGFWDPTKQTSDAYLCNFMWPSLPFEMKEYDNNSSDGTDQIAERAGAVVRYEYQQGSESKLNTYSDGIKVIITIARLFQTYKPMKFFGVVATILAILGIGFMIPVLIEFKNTGLVERFPTLIVCGFVILAAIISFFAGMQLQTITRKNRQDFEMQLHRVRFEKMMLENR